MNGNMFREILQQCAHRSGSLEEFADYCRYLRAENAKWLAQDAAKAADWEQAASEVQRLGQLRWGSRFDDQLQENGSATS